MDPLTGVTMSKDQLVVFKRRRRKKQQNMSALFTFFLIVLTTTATCVQSLSEPIESSLNQPDDLFETNGQDIGTDDGDNINAVTSTEGSNKSNSNKRKSSPFIYDDSVKFTRPFYNVSIAEDAPGRTFASVIVLEHVSRETVSNERHHQLRHHHKRDVPNLILTSTVPTLATSDSVTNSDSSSNSTIGSTSSDLNHDNQPKGEEEDVKSLVVESTTVSNNGTTTTMAAAQSNDDNNDQVSTSSPAMNVSKVSSQVKLEEEDDDDYSDLYPKMGIKLIDLNYQVSYKIIGGDERNMFKAESRKVGNFVFLLIRTKGTESSAVLNREYQDKYHLKVRASVTSSIDKSIKLRSKCDVTVHVTDANDLSPLFYPTNYNLFLPLDTPIDTTVLKVTAFDPDIGLNGEIYYSLIDEESDDGNYQFSNSGGGNFNDNRFYGSEKKDEEGKFADFYIHPTKGTIHVSRPITSWWSSGGHKRRRRTLTIYARDREQGNKGPSSLSANTGSVLAVQSRATVTITIKPPIHNDDFNDEEDYLNEDDDVNGIVNMKKKKNSKSSFSKRGDKSAKYSFFVPENSKFATIIGVINETLSSNQFNNNYHRLLQFNNRHNQSNYNNQQQQQLRYKLMNYKSKFSIDPKSGLLSVRSFLDREQQSMYKLHVNVYETQQQQPTMLPSSSSNNQDQALRTPSPPYTVIVNVEVTDVNDNAPSFYQKVYHTRIREDLPIGTIIYRMIATDVDEGSSGNGNSGIKYSIKRNHLNSIVSSSNKRKYQQQNDEEAFKIDPLTGSIFINQLLDYERKQVYNLTIIAKDDEHLSSSAILLIEIEDVDENKFPPKFVISNGGQDDGDEVFVMETSIKNNSPIGTLVTTITAVDPDQEQGKISYSLVAGNGLGRFTINNENGDITAATSRLGIKSFYWLTVMAKDSSLSPRSLTKSSKSSILHVYIKVAKEENDDVTMNNQTVARGNDHAPQFVTSLYEVVISETMSINESIIQVIATDQDEGLNGQITYSLLSGNVDNMFEIDSITGFIYLIKPLNILSQQPEYYLAVKASDSGTPSLSSIANVQILIIVPEETAPRFESSSISVTLPENVKPGSVICGNYKVFSRTSITYSIININSFNSNPKHLIDACNDERRSSGRQSAKDNELYSLFTIDPFNGEVKVNDQLNYEDINKYDIMIQASNYYNNNSTLLITMLITDSNDHEPIWNETNYFGLISESSLPGTLVIKQLNHLLPSHHHNHNDAKPLIIKAYDCDSGSNGDLEYYINEPHGRKHFSIDPVSGHVSLRREIDFEQFKEINFTISVTDMSSEGSLEAETTASVSVLVTLPDPSFDDDVYILDLKEDTPTGHVIFNGLPNYKGSSSRYKYKLESMKEGTSSSSDEELFKYVSNHLQLDPSSGRISIKNQLDYEEMSVIKFNLIATNLINKSSSASFVINVLDTNDNVPVWNRSVFSGHINEDANIGDVVYDEHNSSLILQATDSDSGKDGQLEFKINEPHGAEYFNLNPSTGLVSLKKKIVYDIRSSIIFTVSVSDLGERPLKADRDALVVISIEKSLKPVTTTTTEKPDPCLSSPCINGGTCMSGYGRRSVNNDDTSDEDEPSFSSLMIATSSTTPSSTSTTTKSTSYTNLDYNCSCPVGFHGNNCEVSNYYCSKTKPCKNRGHCIEVIDGSSCQCPSGYEGDHCEQDVDECSLTESLICPPPATCVNMPGTYRCICSPMLLVGINGSSSSPNNVCSGLFGPTGTSITGFNDWNHLIRMMITPDMIVLLICITIVFLLTICCMCCCWSFAGTTSSSSASKERRRRQTRTPKDAITSNKNSNSGENEQLYYKNTPPDANLKRFSSTDGAAGQGLLSVTSSPGRPLSLNNFDTMRVVEIVADPEGQLYISATDRGSRLLTTQQVVSSDPNGGQGDGQQRDVFAPGNSNLIRKMPPIVTVTPQVTSATCLKMSSCSANCSNASSQLSINRCSHGNHSSNGVKIQNVASASSSIRSNCGNNKNGGRRASLADSDLNVNREDLSNTSTATVEGYHWDCSDWALVNDDHSRNQTPIGGHHTLGHLHHGRHGHHHQQQQRVINEVDDNCIDHDEDDLESITSSIAGTTTSINSSINQRTSNHYNNGSQTLNSHLLRQSSNQRHGHYQQHRSLLEPLDGLSITEHRDSSNSDASNSETNNSQVSTTSQLINDGHEHHQLEQLNQSRNRKGFVGSTGLTSVPINGGHSHHRHSTPNLMNYASNSSQVNGAKDVKMKQQTKFELKEDDEEDFLNESSSLLAANSTGLTLDDIDFVDDSPTSPTGLSKNGLITAMTTNGTNGRQQQQPQLMSTLKNKYLQPHPNSYLPVMTTNDMISDTSSFDLDTSNEMETFNNVLVGNWLVNQQTSQVAPPTSSSAASSSSSSASSGTMTTSTMSSPPTTIQKLLTTNSSSSPINPQLKSVQVDMKVKSSKVSSNEMEEESTFV